MLRLIVKELLYLRWMLAIGCVAGIALILAGDPLVFRGEVRTPHVVWLMLLLFILGLRAYSSELKGDTIHFLYSRPIKWWQVWVSKLAVGIVASIVILGVTALAYMLKAPHPYWLPALKSMPVGLKILLGSYVTGFATSMLAPGIALSFASMVVVLMAFGLPLAELHYIGRTAHVPTLEKLAAATWANLIVLGIPAAFAAGILVARRLPKLDMNGRLLTWLKVPAVVLLASTLLAVFGVRLYPGSRWAEVYELSPNGRWVVYGIPSRYQGEPEKLILRDTRTGQVVHVWYEKMQTHKLTSAGTYGVVGYSWSPDSTKFAYVNTDLKVKVLHAGARPRLETVAKLVCPADMAARRRHDFDWIDQVQWDPAGRKIAIRCWDIAVVDIETRTVSMVKAEQVSIEEALRRPVGTPVQIMDTRQLFWPPGPENRSAR